MLGSEGIPGEVDNDKKLWLNPRPAQVDFALVGYPSGQRGQTVNLLAYAFAGSNPAPTTISLVSF